MATIFSSCNVCIESKSISSSEKNTVPHFINKHMKRIYCKHWHPTKSVVHPNALIYICHGVAEHCDRYEKLVSVLAAKGFFVFSNDHVGHGKSEGDRAHIQNFTDYVDDVVQYVKLVQEKFNDIDIPIFGIGHSMGSTILIMAALSYPELFKGMVLIGPAVIPDPETATPLKVKLAKFMAVIRPQFPVGRIQPQMISRNAQVVEDYDNDPLVYHGGLKARLCVELLNAFEYIKTRIENLYSPLLILHGDKDQIVLLDGAKLLHEKAGSKDKTLKVYEGAFHQIHNEIEPMATEARNEIAEWILKRA